MSDGYEPKIVTLPGTRVSPEVVLHRTLNKKDRIKAIAIVILWDDDSLDVDWSVITTAQMALSALMLSDTARQIAHGEFGEIVKDRE